MPRNVLSTTSIGKIIDGAGGTVVDGVDVDVEGELVVTGLDVGAAELDGANVTGAATVVTRSVDDSRVVALALSATDTLPDDVSSESELQEATAAINRHDMTAARTDEQRIHPGWQGGPSGERMSADSSDV